VTDQNNEVEYWKIAAGERGYLWPQQRDCEVVCVGWSLVGSLRKFGKNKEKFSKAFRRKYPGKGNQLWTFYNRVKKGDWVIACAGSKIFGYGKIDGDYEFRNDLDYSHCRKTAYERVFWEPLEVERLRLDPDIKRLFLVRANQRTVKNLCCDDSSGSRVFEKIKLAITSRPYGVADLAEWEGLRNAPISEQETIVLFSKMSPILRMKISYVGTRYPDAIIRVKEGRQWVNKTAEFERLASGFESHKDEYKSGNRCDMIICWENDWTNKPRWLGNETEIVELREKLGEII